MSEPLGKLDVFEYHRSNVLSVHSPPEYLKSRALSSRITLVVMLIERRTRRDVESGSRTFKVVVTKNWEYEFQTCERLYKGATGKEGETKVFPYYNWNILYTL